MGLDAAVVAAALVLWLAGYHAMLRAGDAAWLRAGGLSSRALGWLGDYLRSARIRAWTAAFVLLGVVFSAIDLERVTLLLYCAAFTAVGVANQVSDNRRWWENSPRRRPRAHARLWAVAYWSADVVGTFGWVAACMFAGRLVVDVLGAG